MRAEAIKLGLIDRLMKMQDKSTLERLEKLVVQVEMETRAKESMEAIKKGDVLSIDKFRTNNQKWLKKKYTK